jgi:subtilase family serine protease
MLAVSVTTRNQGNGSAAASTTRFYLSANTLLDAADVLLAASQSVPPLAAGASASGSVALAVPDTTTTGFYYVIAKADADAAELETNESNNTLSRFVSIGPDLTISGLTAPASAASGSAVLVSETVRNQGAGMAAASTTRFFLSLNAVLDAADPQLVGGRSVPALAQDGVSAGSTTVTLPAGLAAGTYYLFARADGDLAVTETQETNNTTIRSVQIGGDLAVTSLTVPAKAGAGTSIAVNDTTANPGAGAIAASTTRFYLSVNSLLDAADVLLTGARAVPALAAGAASSGITSIVIPTDTATGAYFLIAKADADGVVAETVESNNATARMLAVGPDLAVSALTVPFAITAGAVVSISDTVVNQGGGPAAASVTRYFLSTNVTLDASDLTLAASRSVPALVPSASSAGVTAVTIPAGLAPGTYYLFVKADGDGSVLESQEGNNTNWRAVKVSGS